MHLRSSLLVLVALVAVVAADPPVAVAQKAEPAALLEEPRAEEVREIKKAQDVFRDAYMRRHAGDLSALFHVRAAFAGTLHPYWMEGREVIQRLWEFYFKTYKDAELVIWSSTLRVVARSPAVVQYLEAMMAMPYPPGRGRNIHMRLTIVWAEVAEYTVAETRLRWQIVHMHGSEAPLMP